MSRIVVNVATGRYVKGQARLVDSLTSGGARKAGRDGLSVAGCVARR